MRNMEEQGTQILFGHQLTKGNLTISDCISQFLFFKLSVFVACWEISLLFVVW